MNVQYSNDFYAVSGRNRYFHGNSNFTDGHYFTGQLKELEDVCRYVL